MNWYVLQVLTGQEQEVAGELQRLNAETLVPVENRSIRSQGRWIQKNDLLFPGYVFFQIAFTDGLYHRIKEIAGVVRILSEGGVPAPLSDIETSWIRWLAENLAAPSVIRCRPEGWWVESGALTNAGQILHIDRHRRRAKVRFVLGGQPIDATLSVIFKEC